MYKTLKICLKNTMFYSLKKIFLLISSLAIEESGEQISLILSDHQITKNLRRENHNAVNIRHIADSPQFDEKC